MNDGKACWYRENKDAPWTRGQFVHWGCSYDEYESGPANFTVAVIVDDNTLMVRMVKPDGNMCFAAEKPH